LRGYCKDCGLLAARLRRQNNPVRTERIRAQSEIARQREGQIIAAGYQIGEAKICSQCNEVRSLGDYYKDERHSDGLQSQCRYCFIEKSAGWYRLHMDPSVAEARKYREDHKEEIDAQRRTQAENRKRVRAEIRERKRESRRILTEIRVLDAGYLVGEASVCRYCDQVKPISEFRSNRPSQCYECVRRYHRDAYFQRRGARLHYIFPQPSSEQRKQTHNERKRERDREANRLRMREWHKTPAGIAARKRYVENNKEKLRERTSAHVRRKYQTPEGKAARQARNHSREARKRGLADVFTAVDFQNAIRAFDGCCAACGRQPGLWHTIALDHWIPLSSSDCPGTVPWNIVPLCHGVDGCNNQKSNRDAGEWLIAKFGKRKGRAIQHHIEAFLNGRKPDQNRAG